MLSMSCPALRQCEQRNKQGLQDLRRYKVQQGENSNTHAEIRDEQETVNSQVLLSVTKEKRV